MNRSLSQNIESDTTNNRNFTVIFTPQQIFQGGCKIGLEKWDKNVKSKSWVGHFSLYSGKNFLRTDDVTDKNETVKGVGFEGLRRWYLGKKNMWFIASGIGASYFQVNMPSKNFISFTEDGIEYLHYRNFELEEKIFRLDGLLLIGFQDIELLGFQDKNDSPLLIEAYFGPMIRHSFVESSPIERDNDNWIEDIGFSGIIWRASISIGIRW
ncbi:MAG: hypothetical protein OHK0038_23880 [Flammeovirgaceae bacterium]